MKVLMATDGSLESMTALKTTCRLLHKQDLLMDLVCVAPEFYSPGVGEGDGQGKGEKIRQQYRRQIERETKRILDDASRVLRAEEIESKSITQFGSPAGAIVRLADEYDLTVVGAHGRHEKTKPGLGPVASRVVEHAPSAVLVARELLSERNPRILAGVDGSLASERALELLITHFNLSGSEITLMHVIETPWIHLGLDREWFDYPEEEFDRSDPEILLERELRVEAEAAVERARKRLDAYNLASTPVIELGNPATELLSEAETGEYDLIVLGATGASDVKHKMIGSVSSKVAWNAPCSVAIVKFKG